MADDITAGDPGFLRRVDQLALEVHVARVWLQSRAHAAALGRLWAAAAAAGLELAAVEMTPCAPADEVLGCHAARLPTCLLSCHLQDNLYLLSLYGHCTWLCWAALRQPLVGR